jgi:hypothetical protein
MVDPVETLKEKMFLTCKVLQRQGVVDVYGHLSARLSGDRILSTPHMPPGKAALRDLIIIDIQGKKLAGSGEPRARCRGRSGIPPLDWLRCTVPFKQVRFYARVVPVNLLPLERSRKA